MLTEMNAVFFILAVLISTPTANALDEDPLLDKLLEARTAGEAHKAMGSYCEKKGTCTTLKQAVSSIAGSSEMGRKGPHPGWWSFASAEDQEQLTSFYKMLDQQNPELRKCIEEKISPLYNPLKETQRFHSDLILYCDDFRIQANEAVKKHYAADPDNGSAIPSDPQGRKPSAREH